METVKKGSSGQAVRLLQEKLGVTADGIFGQGTESALKRYQSAHDLTADGICGDRTWASLGVTSADAASSRCVDPSVVYLPLSVHITKLAGRSIRYIAIHYTAGGSSAAGSARRIKGVFEKRQASADFAVDDSEMVQFNPDPGSYYCWSVGDRRNPYSSGGSLSGKASNRNTISIEICSNLRKGTSASAANHEGWSFTEASLENARRLVRILMKRYDVPIERVVRHYDITGKLCPGVIGWNDESVYTTAGKRTGEKSGSSAWEAFRDSI